MARIYVDPFAIILAEHEKQSLGEMLDAVAELSAEFADVDDPESRWFQWGESWICLDDLELKSNHAIGTMYRLRLKDLPSRGGASGISELDLPEHDGLGHHVAFLWDAQKNVLWFQRDRNATTARIFFHYLRDRAGKAVGHSPILRTDAVKRARSIKHYKKIEIALRKGDGPPPAGALFRYLSRLNDEFGAVRVDISISPGRGAYLDAQASRALVPELTDLVGADDDAIAKARLHGLVNEDDDEEVFVDLLRDRNSFYRDLKKDKSRNRAALMQLVRLVWLDNRGKV